MFTGLIQETGVIKYIEHLQHNSKLCVQTPWPATHSAKVGDSIAVNGVCLTITSLEDNFFLADMVPSTLLKTTFKSLTAGSPVNLELALKANDFLGGHIVQGHVNGTAQVKNIIKLDESYELTLQVPAALEKFCIEEGSITVDGVSLTIAKLDKMLITINIIPHTWNKTVIQFYKTGIEVNIESDMIAKYMEKWLAPWLKKTMN